MPVGDGPRDAGGKGAESQGRPLTAPPPPGRPFSPNVLLNKAVCNVIASLTQGRRFEYDDPRLNRLLDLTQTTLQETAGSLPQVRARGRIHRGAGRAFPERPLREERPAAGASQTPAGAAVAGDDGEAAHPLGPGSNAGREKRTSALSYCLPGPGRSWRHRAGESRSPVGTSRP